MMDGGGIFQWISDMAARIGSLFTSFVWKKNKFFLVLNCVVVISFLVFFRCQLFTGGNDNGDFVGLKFMALPWLLIFYMQTIFVRFTVRKRAAPEKPLANLFFFFIFAITSSICSVHGALILMPFFFALLFELSAFSDVASEIGSIILLTILPMLYLHFYILMWGGEGQDET